MVPPRRQQDSGLASIKRVPSWLTLQALLLSVLVLLVTVSLLRSPGTNDVKVWQEWANNVEKFGVVEGFAANEADYPPLASVILFSVVRVAAVVFHLQPFAAIKASLVLALVLTSLVFWLWTKDGLLAVVLHLSLLLNVVALGYIDVYFAPTLLLALWALKADRPALFVVLMSIACLTKFQPTIILPFLFLYVLDSRRGGDLVEFKRHLVVWRYVAPAIGILGVTIFAYGVAPASQAFIAALNQEWVLSGNALNFGWVLTHILRVWMPDRFGGLVHGRASAIVTTDWQVWLIPRLLFGLTYTAVFVSFLRRRKTFENLILFSLLGCLSYFTFNTGVHENHLFIAMLLAALLVTCNNIYTTTMAIILLTSNVNMWLFYGTTGTTPEWSRVVAGVDVALIVAIFNVCFFCYVWAHAVSGAAQESRSPVSASRKAISFN